MPSDIRAFFGNGGQAAPPIKKEPEPVAGKKRGRAKKVIDDDDDEDEPPAKKPTPRKKAPAKADILEVTTADNYFGKGSKPKRSEAVTSKAASKKSAAETPKKANGTSEPASKRSSTRSKKSIKYDDADFDDDDFDDGMMDVDEPKAAVKAAHKETPSKSTTSKVATPASKVKQPKLKEHTQDLDDDDVIEITSEDPNVEGVKPAAQERIVDSKPVKSKKREPTPEDEDGDFEEPAAKPSKAKTAPKSKAPAAKKQKVEDKQDSTELKAIFDAIPTIEPPPPPGKEGDAKPKFQFGGAHANSAAPAGALDSSQMPSGQENCLAGLSFVFTGQLATLGREQGSALVKQYGGKVMAAPSKKTSFVVLGSDAGPKKLQVIKDHSLKVINEEGLFELIKRLPANGGDSVAAEKQAEKVAKEEEAIRKAAEEMEKQERARMTAAKPKPTATSNGQRPPTSTKAASHDPANQLWTTRYAPTQLNQICGNKTQVDKLQRWLRAYPKNQRTKFKMPGPDGSGTFRAVIIHGPPGIGKTTAAHLVAKLEGYDIVESNASDTRSKKLVETGLKGVLSTTSLMGYFSAGIDPVAASKKKLVLIMDEVDGMSAGDRGGVGALAAICKKSQIPMILICNDRKLPKMKPFDYVTFDLAFRRPTTDMIRGRLSTIAFREQLKIPANVMNALIEGSGSDIRQVVNMLSTIKTDEKATMDFEDGKDMSKAWEKHIVLKPWDMIGKIIAGGMFNPAANKTLNDKQELYFNDHEFAPIMMQENYISAKPSRAQRYAANDKKLKLANLQLLSRAADSISDGDLVDRMIHGSQQQWSLMPTHAMFSFVRPASFIYGGLSGQTRFAGWLGKNSTQGKLMRFVKEIQGHMRLRTSVDRYELRQTYIPILFNRLVRRLEKEGKEVVPQLIELMDWYYLTRDDWDAVFELGVGNNDMESVKIESQAKATFTRLYNAQSHPLPFIKASQIVAPKKAPKKDRPDLEEALDESDEGEAVADDADIKAEEDAELDLSKDKYVKQPKKKRAPAKGKKKAGAADDDDEEDEKPKKGKGKAKAKK